MQEDPDRVKMLPRQQQPGGLEQVLHMLESARDLLDQQKGQEKVQQPKINMQTEIR